MKNKQTLRHRQMLMTGVSSLQWLFEWVTFPLTQHLLTNP